MWKLGKILVKGVGREREREREREEKKTKVDSSMGIMGRIRADQREQSGPRKRWTSTGRSLYSVFLPDNGNSSANESCPVQSSTVIKGRKSFETMNNRLMFLLLPSLQQGGILLAHLRALSPPSTLDNRFARFEFAFLEDNPRTFRELSNYLSKFFIFDLLILFIFFFHRESGGKKCKGMWENSERKMVVTLCFGSYVRKNLAEVELREWANDK